MSKNVFSVTTAVAMLGCSLMEAAVSEVFIAKDGQSLAKIVVAQDADKVARFAAADLKWHLEEITGASFEVVSDKDFTADGQLLPICVGPSKLTKTHKADYKFQQWSVDVSDKAIELVGFDREDKGPMSFSITLENGVEGTNWPWMYDEQGTMYAVYDFLEKECGVIWANPTDYGTFIKKNPSLSVKTGFRRCEPWMSYRGGAPLDREVYEPLDWRNGSDGEKRYNEFAYSHPKAKRLQDKLYLLRNRLGGDFAKANHSFYWWYDRFWNKNSKTFERYEPDYFAKGYEGQPPQVCWTNPKVVEQTVEDIRRYFDDPEFRKKYMKDVGRDGFIWGENNYCLEPMDNSSYCKCERCEAMYDKIANAETANREADCGVHSRVWFDFVNKVAKEIKKSHPGKRITTLAYKSHEALPAGIHLEDNVTVYFCIFANRMPYAAALDHQLKRMKDWRDAYPEQPLAMWLYNTFPFEIARNGGWYCFPGFFAHAAAKQYQFFKANNIRGGVLQCGFKDDIDNYMQMKWMVDPDRDPDQMIDEYFSGAGKAAEPLKAFYRLVESRYCDSALYPQKQEHQTVRLAWSVLGDAPTMDKLGKLMVEAEAKAETDFEKGFVKVWKLAIWDYMKEGFDSYTTRSTAPRPEWKAVRISAAGGDTDKIDWTKIPQFDTPLYHRGSDNVKDIREQVRLAHDDTHFYLEITEWVDTSKLMVCNVIAPCDTWELVVARQEAQPYRYYLCGADGRMEGLSYGEVNWRQGVPAKESGDISFGARLKTDRTHADHWIARWAFPLDNMADKPLKAGDKFHLNCARVINNSICGRVDHWMFAIFSLTSYTTVHTCDRAGSVILE